MAGLIYKGKKPHMSAVLNFSICLMLAGEAGLGGGRDHMAKVDTVG